MNFEDEFAEDIELDKKLKMQRIPESTKLAIDGYVSYRAPVGEFVKSVLANDLIGAFRRADVRNTSNMWAIVSYVYNHVPTGCWGSYEIVYRWIKWEKDELE